MATSPVTRASLIQRVATRANTSGYADATTVGGEVSQLVDLGIAKMHNLLVGLYEDYFIAKKYYTLVANEDTYLLPADMMKPRQVFYEDSTLPGRYPLNRLAESDLIGLPLSTNYTALPTGYVIEGNTFVIYPRPTASITSSGQKILMKYIPQYTPPLNDSTPIEYAVAFGWDEWVVNDAVVQIRNKAMMDASAILQERNQIEQRIRHEAKQRNAGDPPRVRDTGWGGNSPYNRWSQFAIK